MDRWNIGPGPVIEPSPDLSSMILVYLWGFLFVFAIAVVLGGRLVGSARNIGDELWSYFVAAVLWPLFVCAVLFVILWNMLSRNKPDH